MQDKMPLESVKNSILEHFTPSGEPLLRCLLQLMREFQGLQNKLTYILQGCPLSFRDTVDNHSSLNLASDRPLEVRNPVQNTVLLPIVFRSKSSETRNRIFGCLPTTRPSTARDGGLILDRMGRSHFAQKLRWRFVKMVE